MILQKRMIILREAPKKRLRKKSDSTTRGRTNKSTAAKKHAAINKSAVTKKTADVKQKKEKLIYSNEISNAFASRYSEPATVTKS